MITLCDAWLAQSPRFRFMCACGWILGLLMMVALCLHPATRQRGMRQQALNQQRAAIETQWRNLYLLASSPRESEETFTPFSPLLFQTPLARLIHWQPTIKGGEMTLRPAWEAIPPMFAQLAEQGMNVSRFSLSVEGAELLLMLQLEHLNDG